MLRVIVVVVVVLVAVSAAVSAKFRRSALEQSVSVVDYRACLDAHPWELKACDGKRAEERDLLHVHLHTNPYGVDDDIAPQP